LLTAIRDADPADARAGRLRRTFSPFIDFFPGRHAPGGRALAQLEARADGEPTSVSGKIRRLASADFQGRTWATRRHLWVDRMACGWLIRRFIDPQATFLWLDDPGRCPPQALGFDFDGAAFTHVGGLVSFEVLAASFALGTIRPSRALPPSSIALMPAVCRCRKRLASRRCWPATRDRPTTTIC
jgi:hypothetical protein